MKYLQRMNIEIGLVKLTCKEGIKRFQRKIMCEKKAERWGSFFVKREKRSFNSKKTICLVHLSITLF